MLSRERQVQKAAEDTQLFVSQNNRAFRWEDISLYVSVLGSVLVCPRNQILLVPTQIIAFLHCNQYPNIFKTRTIYLEAKYKILRIRY